uniref:Ubiquitin thioesterase OTU n=1 Tax=Spongospora subterranea TaxID=70186 RepID=A0A0H5R6S0_9EUKA|eukprot:CRZ09815.1 hypothetical protein [Spongospora subterranea]
MYCNELKSIIAKYFTNIITVMTILRLRCKTPSGSNIVIAIDDEQTIADLYNTVRSSAGVNSEFQLSLGAHPKNGSPLGDPHNTQLRFCANPKIQTADTLTISLMPTEDYMEIFQIPDDNSCLFNAIRHALSSTRSQDTLDDPAMMRSVVAAMISSDSERFSPALLGKPVVEYCNWIMNTDSWGGEIELAILSEYYQIQLKVIDIRTQQILSYFNSVEIAYLLYDGIHYNILQRKSGRCVFSVDDAFALTQAKNIALQALQDRKFTDVNAFQLRCEVCKCGLTGQAEAVQHMKVSGHTQFAEYK